MLRLCRFQPRNCGLSGSDSSSHIRLRQARLGPRSENFVQEGELVGRRVIRCLDFGTRKGVPLELLEGANVTSFIRRRAISSSLDGVFSVFFTNW